jgi:penicillin-binding protein 2
MESVSGYDEYEERRQIGRRLDVLLLIALAIFLLLLARLYWIQVILIGPRLGLDRKWLARRFEEAKYEPKYLPVVLKENASASDVAWIVAHQFERPELRVEEMPQRRYVYGAFAAHALGYVGEVSRRELEKGPYSRENGYRMGDVVGKSGLERIYNEILTGKDGERIVVVDSRGRIREEVERAEPTPGRDLRVTLDFELQKVAEEQADLSPTSREARSP